MHFPTFNVASTNIFPLSNSTKGGQLVTEYNLRSREMVNTKPEISYEVGPSFVHGPEDFKVTLTSSIEAPEYSNRNTYTIGEYVTYNSSTYVCIENILTPEPFNSSKWALVTSVGSIIQVAPGRAVINGHFVQSTATMSVDLVLANAQLALNNAAPLLGKLSIGIKSYYSEETTMAGSMLVENEDNTYIGIQLVILPTQEFITPADSPDDRDKVTADLKLADFIYINGVVSTIELNPERMSCIDSRRIGDVSQLFNDHFISKDNLNPHMLYTFSGQGSQSDKSTWCDSTGSLMVWDSEPQNHLTNINPNEVIPQATFLSTSDGYVHLAVPHQQIDSMKNTAGENLYFSVRDIKLPKANYLSGAPGTVDAEYTQVIKNLGEKLSGLQTVDVNSYIPTASGNLILYLDTKDVDYVMPTIPTSYQNGDYIFVREDFTARISTDAGAAPSTMYKVLPGAVSNIDYAENLPSGVRLGDTAIGIWTGDNEGLTDYDETTDTRTVDTEALKHLADFYDTDKLYLVDEYTAYNGALYKCVQTTHGDWDSSKWTKILNEDAVTLFGFTSYRGSKNKDYFEVDLHNDEDNTVISYYYVVTGTGPRTWSDFILVTGGIPLATTTQAGGFYNTDPLATDGGYVTLDSSGRLKLIDYELLRSGTLAYQLGEDFTMPTSLTSSVIQENLDEYVNNRIAFPFTMTSSATSQFINIYITLPEESNPTVITLCNIDSRFGTAVYLHILGKANSNTIINIVDCEKIRIDNNISGTPVINIYRSCIYYDAAVFDYIKSCVVRDSSFTGFSDISLWYERFKESDPNIQINGMEVSQPDASSTVQDITFWNEANPNDNHYSTALRSITFGNNGNVIECSLYVANGSTATNVIYGRSIIGGVFNLPQGSELIYPEKCVVKPLKVTGNFVTAYKVQNNNWIMISTNFTAVTGIYKSSSDTFTSGTIAFDATTDLLNSQNMTMDVPAIDGWEPNSYHVFYGGSTINGTII